MSDQTAGLAKLTWEDPRTGERSEFVLAEGATATIGRSPENDICIPEQHVSRRHAVVNYRDGMFMITDLGSANGTYINDEQIDEPFPLMQDDIIRLYVPLMSFSANVTEEEQARAESDGKLITASVNTGQGKLVITNGPQEGHIIPLLLNRVTVGRATSSATWEIGLQDASVSRPHARLELIDGTWMLLDLGSSNGTFVNSVEVNEKGRPLRDGDTIAFGATLALFRRN